MLRYNRTVVDIIPTVSTEELVDLRSNSSESDRWFHSFIPNRASSTNRDTQAKRHSSTQIWMRKICCGQNGLGFIIFDIIAFSLVVAIVVITLRRCAKNGKQKQNKGKTEKPDYINCKQFTKRWFGRYMENGKWAAVRLSYGVEWQSESVGERFSKWKRQKTRVRAELNVIVWFK